MFSRSQCWGRIAIFACLLVTAALAIVPLIPKTPNVDVVRIYLDGGMAEGVSQVQIGLLSFCIRRATSRSNADYCKVVEPCDFANSTSNYLCHSNRLGYSLTIGEGLPDEDPLQINSSWIRALDVYVVFVGGVFLSCILYVPELFPYTSRPFMQKLRLWVYLLNLLVSIISIICIAVYTQDLKRRTGTLFSRGYGQRINVGPGSSLIFVSCAFLISVLIIDLSTTPNWKIKRNTAPRAMALVELEEQQTHESRPLAEKSSSDEATDSRPDPGDDVTLQGSVSRRPSLIPTDGHTEVTEPYKTDSKPI